jgi:hypothetical protein
MKSFIKLMRTAIAPIPLIANRTGYGGADAVIYDLTTISYDKLKRLMRVKATIVSDSMENALAIENKLDEALVTFGDNPLTDTVLSCSHDGGGWMTDGDRHIRIAYYETTIKGGNL